MAVPAWPTESQRGGCPTRWRHLFSKLVLTPISRSFRKKMLLLLFLLAIFPLVTATVISYANTKTAIERLAFSQNNSRMDWVQQSVNEGLERINNVLTAFYYDSDVSFYINKIDSTGAFGQLGATFFRNKIKSHYFASYQDFRSVRLYLPDALKAYAFSLDEGLSVEALQPDFLTTDPILSDPSELQFEAHAPEDYRMAVKPDGPVMVKYYRRFEDRRLLAVLTARLSWKLFDDSIALLASEADSQVYVVRADGDIIYGHFTETPSKKDLQAMLDQALLHTGDTAAVTKTRCLFARKITGDIYILKTMPIEIIRKTYVLTLNFQLLLILTAAILIGILAIFLGYTVTRPITQLAQSMHEVEQYIETDRDIDIVHVRTNDEIRILEQSYRMMVERIRRLINQEYRQKIEKQSAQLMALQAQIHPHFLFNTLQMIGAMAVRNNDQDLYGVISAFSRMMRYSMRMSDVASIGGELENADHYLEIQRHRFAGKLHVERTIDASCLPCLLPKLSIQPLLENCFKHGFTARQSQWRIHITVVRDEAVDGDAIRITVADNGTGIRREKADAIEAALAGDDLLPVDRQESLGLHNIHARIRLIFGTECGLYIQPGDGGGTVVTLRIAARTNPIHPVEERDVPC